MTPRPDGPDGGRARTVYFGPQTESLFGWYHPPHGTPRDASVVICAPFGVEAVFAHRALRHLAERLARDGFPVLRYDHHGTGDSSGAGTEPDRVAVWLRGVRVAMETARDLSGVPRIALVGLRLGATLGAAVGSESGGIDSLVLWAPVENGRRYARELGAFSQMGLAPGGDGVGGFYVSPETLSAMAELNLTRLARRPAPRVLVIPRDDLPADGTLEQSLSALGADVRTDAVAGYAAALAEPHKTEVPELVIESIASWLSAGHGVSVARDAGPDMGGSTRARESLVTSEGDDANGSAHEVRERSLFLDVDQRLFGVIAEPASVPLRATTIVLVNAGAVARVGPNRLYVTMARQWAAMGFAVLRMDIGGMGDSSPLPGLPENDTYPPTAVSDVVAAIEALRAEGKKRFVVAGLCSGAHTAFHLGIERTNIAGVAGLILINPIVFYWKPGDALDVSAWRTYAEARRYTARARSPRAWLRLVQGRVNVLDVAVTFMRRGVTLATAAYSRARSRGNPGGGNELAGDLTAMAARPLDLFMVFSDGDPGLDQLRLDAAHVLRRLRRRSNFHLEIVPNADHTFTQRPAQAELLALLAEHLGRRFT